MDTEGNKIQKIEEQQIFDLDVYKILRRYMRNPANHQFISRISETALQNVLLD